MKKQRLAISTVLFWCILAVSGAAWCGDNGNGTVTLAGLAGRKLDMIATPLAITEERKQRVAFSDPYYTIDSLAVALKKNIVAR